MTFTFSDFMKINKTAEQFGNVVKLSITEQVIDDVLWNLFDRQATNEEIDSFMKYMRYHLRDVLIEESKIWYSLQGDNYGSKNMGK